MPGTSSKTRVIGLRVLNETADRWKAEADSLGVPLTALLECRMDGGGHVIVAGKTVMVKSAQADEIVELKKALAAPRPLPSVPRKLLAALRSDPANRIIDPKLTQSVGHPVLTSAVPTTVAGNVGWCGLKGQDKAKGKGKS